MMVKLQTDPIPKPLNQSIWRVDPRILHFNKLPGGSDVDIFLWQCIEEEWVQLGAHRGQVYLKGARAVREDLQKLYLN